MHWREWMHPPSSLSLAKKIDVDIVGYLLYPGSRVLSDVNERITIVIELL